MLVTTCGGRHGTGAQRREGRSVRCAGGAAAACARARAGGVRVRRSGAPRGHARSSKFSSSFNVLASSSLCLATSETSAVCFACRMADPAVAMPTRRAAHRDVWVERAEFSGDASEDSLGVTAVFCSSDMPRVAIMSTRPAILGARSGQCETVARALRRADRHGAAREKSEGPLFTARRRQGRMHEDVWRLWRGASIVAVRRFPRFSSGPASLAGLRPPPGRPLRVADPLRRGRCRAREVSAR